MVMSPVANTYPLSSYNFGTKEPKMEKDTSVVDQLARMKVKSKNIIILTFYSCKFGNTFCRLSGGRLKPGENGVQEAFPYLFVRERALCSTKKFETSCCTIV